MIEVSIRQPTGRGPDLNACLWKTMAVPVPQIPSWRLASPSRRVHIGTLQCPAAES
jgi:hypothetical protein